MIEKGFESFQIDVVNEVRTVKIANTFWNRRKLKKLKIDFKEQLSDEDPSYTVACPSCRMCYIETSWEGCPKCGFKWGD